MAVDLYPDGTQRDVCDRIVLRTGSGYEIFGGEILVVIALEDNGDYGIIISRYLIGIFIYFLVLIIPAFEHSVGNRLGLGGSKHESRDSRR